MHSLLLCQKLGVCGEAAPAGTALQSKPCSLPHHACPRAGAGTSWHGPLCHLALTRAGAAGIFSWHLDALVVPVQPRLVIRGGMAAARWISHRLVSPASLLRAEGCSHVYGNIQDRGDKVSWGPRTRESGSQQPEQRVSEVAAAEMWPSSPVSIANVHPGTLPLPPTATLRPPFSPQVIALAD